MLLAVLVALAQLSSQTPPATAPPPFVPARGHPLVLLKADGAHRALEQSLAAGLRAGGIATLDSVAMAHMTTAEIDRASLGARLFACSIGPVHFRWPASRPPSAEILIFPRKVGKHAQRPRLMIVTGHGPRTQGMRTDTWLPIPPDLTSEAEHTITEAVTLWILARSGA